MHPRRSHWLALAVLALPTLAQQPLRWVAPAEAVSRANPVPFSDDALKRGRVLFGRHCALCHGEGGTGDGPAARMHAQRSGHAPRNLTDPKVQLGMTDGEIFWKLSTGLKDNGHIVMPGFAEEIAKEDDRWRLVHFVRMFGKQM